jgi:glycine hydroxymethyltransferase
MKEPDMITVVDFLDTALMHADNESKLSSVREEVNIFMQKFPLYPELG